MNFKHYIKDENIPKHFDESEAKMLKESVAYYISKNKIAKMSGTIANERFGICIRDLKRFNIKVKNAIGQGCFSFRKSKVEMNEVKKVAPSMGPIAYAKWLGVDVGGEWTPPQAWDFDL